MGTDDSPAGWLLLLAQLPSTPSRIRVALWRQLRAAGATAMVNGAWVLPDTAAHAALFEQLRQDITRQHGTGFVLAVPDFPPDVSETVVQRFRADRAKEYGEFAERCGALRDEIGKESRAEKYTFAELEESEQDLDKLARWLVKIQARDFFPDGRGEQATAEIAGCRSTLNDFAQAVYRAEGVLEAGPADSSQPASTENGRPGSGGANASSATSRR
jgi:ChrB-like protein